MQQHADGLCWHALHAACLHGIMQDPPRTGPPCCNTCRHSPELAQAVIDSGALDSLVTCLEEFDPGVKEAATWCLGYIAGHNTELAQQVVDAGEPSYGSEPSLYIPLLERCAHAANLSRLLLTPQ